MSRSAELRQRYRRVLTVSLVIAAGIHVLIFVGSPEFHVSPQFKLASNPDLVVGEMDADERWGIVNVFFGRPEIISDDGTVRREPPERVLEVYAVAVARSALPRRCHLRNESEVLPAEGRVRVQVDGGGLVVWDRIEQSEGDECGNALLTTLSGSLWYQWIPNDRFPAPVELIQPVRVVAAAE